MAILSMHEELRVRIQQGHQYLCRVLVSMPHTLTVLKEHSHQVLYASFAHSDKMFPACSKHGYILVTSVCLSKVM
jgi:hypothetical protein